MHRNVEGRVWFQVTSQCCRPVLVPAYHSVQAKDLSVDHWLHFRHHFPKIIFPVFIARRDEKIVTKRGRKNTFIYWFVTGETLWKLLIYEWIFLLMRVSFQNKRKGSIKWWSFQRFQIDMYLLGCVNWNHCQCFIEIFHWYPNIFNDTQTELNNKYNIWVFAHTIHVKTSSWNVYRNSKYL